MCLWSVDASHLWNPTIWLRFHILCNTCTSICRFKSRTTKHWLSVLEGSGMPYGPINNMQQVFSEPQVGFKTSAHCRSLLRFFDKTSFLQGRNTNHMVRILSNSTTARPIRIRLKCMWWKVVIRLADGKSSQNIVSHQIIISQIYFWDMIIWMIVCMQKCNSSTKIQWFAGK